MLLYSLKAVLLCLILRNVDEQRIGTIRTLEFTPDKSQITGSSDVCLSPGSVVWAKKAHQLWWPAEISIVGSPSPSLNSSIQDTVGLVLVQYYGNQERAWVDPARDLSPFEDELDVNWQRVATGVLVSIGLHFFDLH